MESLLLVPSPLLTLLLTLWQLHAWLLLSFLLTSIWEGWSILWWGSLSSHSAHCQAISSTCAAVITTPRNHSHVPPEQISPSLYCVSPHRWLKGSSNPIRQSELFHKTSLLSVHINEWGHHPSRRESRKWAVIPGPSFSLSSYIQLIVECWQWTPHCPNTSQIHDCQPHHCISHSDCSAPLPIFSVVYTFISLMIWNYLTPSLDSKKTEACQFFFFWIVPRNVKIPSLLFRRLVSVSKRLL